jgi:hypothetical protein
MGLNSGKNPERPSSAGATATCEPPVQSQAGVFRQNREFHSGESTDLNPVDRIRSHTFIYTTNPDGTLANTYSWGNDYTQDNPTHWYMDRPEDVSAAQRAIEQRRKYESATEGEKASLPHAFGEKVGGPELVPYVDQAYRNLRDNPDSPSAHANWLLFRNCKTEATRLTEDAQDLQQQDTKQK